MEYSSPWAGPMARGSAGGAAQDSSDDDSQDGAGESDDDDLLAAAVAAMEVLLASKTRILSHVTWKCMNPATLHLCMEETPS